jgi:hypothetical protein
MSKPYKCPACDGWGYRRIETSKETTAGPIYSDHLCKACNGTGIVWEPEDFFINLGKAYKKLPEQDRNELKDWDVTNNDGLEDLD